MRKLKRSDFAQKVLRLKGESFHFKYHAPFKDIYDWPHYSILLKTARQVGKSTMLAADTVTDSMLYPNERTFYATTSERQAREFARVKLNEFLARSPLVRKYLLHKNSYDVQDAIFDKNFANGSGVTISYMKDNADRTRGYSADRLKLDEIQDMDPNEIPVVLEVLSASLNPKRMYAGTPKTVDNPIEQMWRKSTMHEIFFKCVSCGKWNDIGYKNIGKKGPICASCGGNLDMNEHRIWATCDDVEQAKYIGVRVPQPALRLHYGFENKWKDLLSKYEEYDDARFNNEVLGISFSSGVRFITEEDLVACCVPGLSLLENPSKEDLRPYYPVVAGIDWSGDGADFTSKTVLVIYGEIKGDNFMGKGPRLQLLYYKIYPKQDYMVTINDIVATLHRYGVLLVGADAGEGALNNSYLADSLGANRVQPFRYGRFAKLIQMSPDGYTVHLDKTAAVDDFFKALKPYKKGDINRGGKFIFPNPKYMKEPFRHILSEHEHTTRAGNRIWMRGVDPDDFLHASVFAYNAYKIVKGQVKFY